MNELKIVATVDGKRLLELVRILADRDEKGALDLLREIFEKELRNLDSG
jgi:hypothetical protein